MRSRSSPQAYLLGSGDGIPNHPRWPLLLYPAAVEVNSDDLAAAFEALFDRNHWPAAWRNGVYDHAHFHTTAHEALGIYRGEVTVQFGGSQGVVLTAKAGDVVVLPAGTGHKRLRSRGKLGVVGAYPRGQIPDVCTPTADQLDTCLLTVATVVLPARDPVEGDDGALFTHWR